MKREELLNDMLVMLFNEILDMEHKALICGSYKEISINDM
ncbi:MAG TPA: MarR family transcriptional regulator, partial [Lachnospiraceae bacterium]|nr:MarR family transcriptional regulator [Lachnospiraceae bacterium]